VFNYNILTGAEDYTIAGEHGDPAQDFESFENNTVAVPLSELGFNDYPDSVKLTSSSTVLLNQLPSDHAIVSKIGNKDYYGSERVQDDALDIGAAEAGGGVAVDCPEITGTYANKTVSLGGSADTLTINATITHSDSVTFSVSSSISTVVTAAMISGTTQFTLTPGDSAETSVISMIATPDGTALPTCKADTVSFDYTLEIPKPEASGIENDKIIAKTDETTRDTLIVTSSLDGVTLSATEQFHGDLSGVVTMTDISAATKSTSKMYEIVVEPSSEDFPEDLDYKDQTIKLEDETNSMTTSYKITIAIDYPESTETEELSSRITISPNPGSGLFYISSDLEAINVPYQLVDVSGVVLQTGTFEELSGQELDLSSLGAGVYLLTMNIEGTPITARLIVN
jgi:hypothetical protein